jgi:hypothetical protein
MDAARIHAKIYAGRGKAALRLGLLYDVMRPVIAADPFTQKVARLNAAFNNTDNKYLKANHPGDPLWYGDLDGRQTLAGDYLVGRTVRTLSPLSNSCCRSSVWSATVLCG